MHISIVFLLIPDFLLNSRLGTGCHKEKNGIIAKEHTPASNNKHADSADKTSGNRFLAIPTFDINLNLKITFKIKEAM